jgi:hypothetical protein
MDIGLGGEKLETEGGIFQLLIQSGLRIQILRRAWEV